jgi:hypothetical protein
MSGPDRRTEPRDERSALGADLIIPALAAAFTIYFLVTTAEFVWEAKANGVVIGTTLLVLVAAQVVRTVVHVARRHGHLGFGELAEISPEQGRRLALIAVLCAFVATIDLLGTSLGLFVTMIASMWILGARSARRLLTVALITTVTVYLLFFAFLEARLPEGVVENAINAITGGES